MVRIDSSTINVVLVLLVLQDNVSIFWKYRDILLANIYHIVDTLQYQNIVFQYLSS